MKNKTKQAIDKFVNWLEKNGEKSYDQYDFWSSKYGQISKKIYYKNTKIGAIFVAPIFIFELFIPSIRKLFSAKKQFPIADAHIILAHVNMYKATSDELYIKKAEALSTQLLKSSINGFSGYCWGYPFDWMTTRGLWTRSTPLITSTPYCFEAYLALFDTTQNEKYEKIAKSIFEFSLNDLNNSIINETTYASSYSPIDHSKVLNASAYRSFVLIQSSKRFNRADALEIGEKLIRFILQSQREDGSWLYGLDHPNDEFIDNFHTCFILKNLFKVNLILQRDDLKSAIEKGYFFYKSQLLTAEYIPKPFVKIGRINLVKEEMYDYAEGISLGVLLNDEIKNSIVPSEKMIQKIISEYQTKEGYFITKIMSFNLKNKIPYLRWPQAQLYFALSNYLVKTSK